MGSLPNKFASRREPSQSKFVEDEEISIGQSLEIDVVEPTGIILPT
jgi:hypothetical protein